MNKDIAELDSYIVVASYNELQIFCEFCTDAVKRYAKPYAQPALGISTLLIVSEKMTCRGVYLNAISAR